MAEISDGLIREEALDVTRSFIVQAPAGSGKTELLMQRYLALLSKVERPEEILALTFTRKAAGEMQNRILGSLINARDGAIPDEPHRKKTFLLARKVLERDISSGWGLLENPGRLKVQTIDSLCASLTRQMPLLSLMGRQPSITEEPEELYTEAAGMTVQMVEADGPDGDSVRKALRHLDNSVRSLTARLVLMLSRRDQWMRHVKRKDDGDLRELLEGSLRRLVEDALRDVKEAAPTGIIGVLLASARYAAFNVDEKSPIKGLAGITGLPTESADELPLWRGIRELLLTADNSLRKPKGVNKTIGFPSDKTVDAMRAKEAFQGLLERLEGSAFASVLASVQALPDPSFDEGEWETLSSLLHLLPVARRHLTDVFRREGVVDFPAVSMAALEALGREDDPTDLMLSLDLKIQHILVDEYQDTSRTQLELLKALTRGWVRGDGRTLFAVGDPMQSIYLFREAEVGLFLAARIKGIGDIRLAPLTLKTNFRSQENIIEWVNGTFTPAFPDKEEIFTGSIKYSPSTAHKNGIDGVKPKIFLFEGRDDSDEAKKAVSIIKGIDRTESIAVLCRSRAHLDEVVEVLKREGMDFRAEEFDPLEGRVVIQDLLALHRALTHPYDRVAWLAALRAPWCGAGLHDLHGLCSGDKESPVWALLNDKEILKKLSEDGRERLSSFALKMGKALSVRGRIPPRALLEGLWVDLGGPAGVEDESAMKDAEAFFDLAGSLTVAGEVSLKSLEERVNGLFASHSGMAGVNIDLMTIHKAKGLEFDHVIIPGAGKLPRRPDKKLLLWMERDEDLLLAPMESKAGGCSPLYSYLGIINKRKEELERLRLFYVACTRAKKDLYILGHVKEVEEGNIEVEAGSLLSSIRAALKREMIVRKEARAKDPVERPCLKLKRLPSPWINPAPAPSIRVEKAKEAIEASPEYYWAGETVRHLGTVVHRYLCRIAKEGVSAWGAERVIKERGRIKALLRSLGLSAAKVDEAASRGMDILSAALKDKRGRWILEDHPEGSVELPLTGVFDNELIHAVIDRTFVEGGVRWIIDYKTSLHEGGSLDEFLRQEKERYAPQLERYSSILEGGGEKRRIKKGLYYPALSAWVEW